MSAPTNTRLGRIGIKNWLALPLSVALGGLLVAALLITLRPGAALAAGAASYPCTEAGLNSALAAGGSATFACGAPTTVIVSAIKVANKNVTLDGGNKLTLSGGNARGILSVPVSIHLNLINLTLRDAQGLAGGAVYNAGSLAVTHTQFISNSAPYGGAVFNAPNASTSLFNVAVNRSFGKGGQVWNGSYSLSNTIPGTLNIQNSLFETNTAGDGAVIFNQAGTVNVDGSRFTFNSASTGGAIFNMDVLHVSHSTFNSNFSGLVFDSQAALPDQPAGLSAPQGTLIPIGLGGAIYGFYQSRTFIASSAFTQNIASKGGGAVYLGFGNYLGGPGNPLLSVDHSTFFSNCSGGGGGALGSSFVATVRNSDIEENFADNNEFPCVSWAAAHTSLPALRVSPAPDAPSGGSIAAPSGLPGPTPPAGSGGGLLNVNIMTVENTSLIYNNATVTATGGGGGIANGALAQLSVADSTFASNSALQDGGALFNAPDGQVSVVNSTFEDNTAQNDSGGAVANMGHLTVLASSFSSNYGAPGQGELRGGGGAIFSSQTLVLQASGPQARPLAPQGPSQPAQLSVDRSRFISNASEFEGGAIDASLTRILRSTFTSNTAAYGGALDVLSDDFVVSDSLFMGNKVVTTTINPANEGGAIDGNETAMSIINSTFYGNQATGNANGGAIQVEGGHMGITNSTFLSNSVANGVGGAFAQNSLLVAKNLLIGTNIGGNCEMSMTLDLHSIDYPPSSCSTSALHSDPRALAPADNGGPTWTSALLAGSPAINAGTNSGCPSTDQRGAHRVGVCDIGAFEFGGIVARLRLPVVQR